MQFRYLESEKCHRLDCGDYEFTITTLTDIVILKKKCFWDIFGTLYTDVIRADALWYINKYKISYTSQQIENVNKQIMDQWEKMYEPGGSEFEKCQEQIKVLLQSSPNGTSGTNIKCHI